METHTLHDLHLYLRRVIGLNFPEAVWVRCEIAQAQHSRGHLFVEFVEKDPESNSIKAKAQGVIWSRTLRRIQKQIGREWKYLLQDGMEVLVKVLVDFHEEYGLKLVVEELDPSYSLGQMEIKRRAILEQLQKEGLIGLQKQLPLPLVMQHIAVISSKTAAGFQDFLMQLENNDYRYHYDIDFYPSAMQGNKVEEELLHQMDCINRSGHAYDCIVIIRGGGAKLDLASFDNFNIAKALATCQTPVLIGIGHEIDETILDKVARISLKTPTAVADFLIHQNLHFEGNLMNLGQQIKASSQEQLNTAHHQLDQTIQALAYSSKKNLDKAHQMLDFIKQELPQLVKFKFKEENLNLDNLDRLVHQLHPDQVFKRGFSMTLKEGRVITDANALQEGDELQTQLHTGVVHSTVHKKGSINGKEEV